MTTSKLSQQFYQWADEALAKNLPDGIAAFHFNMYDTPETHDVEIVGCPVYAPDDSDWACDDIFMSEEPRFELPHGVVGQHWEQGLEAAKQLLQAYLATSSNGARRLKESLAVSIGFVDGDLHLAWSRPDA